MLHILEAFVFTVQAVLTLTLSTPPNHTQVMNQQGFSVIGVFICSMRAIRCRYDPYIQTRQRVEQLRRLGHRYT